MRDGREERKEMGQGEKEGKEKVKGKEGEKERNAGEEIMGDDLIRGNGKGR